LYACCAVLAVLTLFTASADAVTTSWNINTNGQFTTAANWNNGVPNSADVAVFDRGSGVTYTVTFRDFLIPGADFTSDRLVVGSNTVTFNPFGATDYFLDNTTTIEADPILGLPVRGITIGADATDTAAVLVSHLALLEAVAATLGHATGSSGTLTLDQNNDLLNLTGGSTTDAELIIGRLGTGVLNVSAGADVTVNGVTGGMFSLPAGSVSLGRNSSGQGTANISGAGSTLDVNTLLIVGDAGTGTLNVTAGGLVESLSGILGDLPGSTGTVTISGAGSRWNVAFLAVGDAGTGTLNVLDGGTIDITNVGIVDVNGASTLNLDNGTIDGDVDNSGQINVTGPAAINGSLTNTVNADTLIDWGEPCCSMVFNVGGPITNSGTFTVASAVEQDVTVQLAAGQTLTNTVTGEVNLEGPADLNADGMISGKRIIGGNVVNNGQLNVRTNAQITGSLTTAVDSQTVVHPAQPCCNMALEVAGPVANSGTFTMQVDSISPCCNVTLELGAGQTFTNNATGVVNLNGPADAGGGETIESKHIIGANVVNNGEMNVRTNTEVTGSLTTAVNAETLVEPIAPCCNMTLEVAGPVANSGTFRMTSPAAMAGAGAGGGGGAANHQYVVLQADGGFTNSGTFTMQIDSAQPCCSVMLQLGEDETFTNTATGVVNFDGPDDLGGVDELESKNVLVGDVVNQGEMNVRTNTEIAGSLTLAVDSETLLSQAEPTNNIRFQVSGGLSNSGTMALVPEPDSIQPCCNVTLEIGAGQALTNNESGVLQGQGIIDGNVVNRGTVQPGNSTGVLTIAGDYTQESAGKIVVEVAGTIAGSGYDQLAVGGEITLDGVVEVIFGEQFVPQVGNRFEIITTVEPINDNKFAGASLPGLPEGMDWGIHYGANLVSLSIGVPGDYNGNGTVDAADYTVWRDTLGQTGVFLAADGNQNDEIDAGDYEFWKLHFGETAGGPGSGSAAATSIIPAPEPNAMILALVGIMFMRRRFTRH
jgi:T5SS/PEP-CTERM-associated repeat protein